jgi:hypothetical protein
MSDDRPVSWLLIEHGWAVVASDGASVGQVHEVVGDTGKDIFDGLTISTGALARPKYVEAERVGEITSGRVTLTIDSAEAESLPVYEEPAPVQEIVAGTESLTDRVRRWIGRL